VLVVAAYIRYVTPTCRVNDRVSTVEDARIILGGIAPSPIEVKEAGQALIGQVLNDQTIQAAAEACYIKARPLDNTDFVMNWRKQMARQYTIRALEDLRTQSNH
jgi:CO/xanthine dehydrogenase FAD-binding subunit